MRGSKNTCRRLWQVEAVADDRLSQADRGSFERHLETCRECQDEHQVLERLHRTARRLSAEESTPLQRRFLHNELLRRANERVLGKAPAHGWVSRRWLVVLATTFCAAVAALLAFPRPNPERPFASAKAQDEPRFEIVAARAGRWRVLQRGPELRLAVSAGDYTMTVTKLHSKQRFVVILPDGELEVRGTRFELAVGAKTLRVAVSEGRVALRLHGAAERMLGAGDSWPDAAAPERSATRAPSASPAQSLPRGAARRGAPSPSARVVGASPLPGKAPSSTPEPVPGAEPPAAASEFATAMAAFSRGDFATAEQLFLAFEARHANNTHVEDTLFLRAVGRLRRGDDAGARALAQEYLRRYPSGFRVLEARRMAE